MIFHSRITKLAAAAAIVLAATATWKWGFSETQPGRNGITAFSLLSEAYAAENVLFNQQGIIHIINETVVRPVKGKITGEPRSFLNFHWLPTCALESSGKFRLNQLNFPANLDREYRIADESWYDSGSCRFVRVMNVEGKLVFANAYDGSSVHWSETASDDRVSLKSGPTGPNFQPPRNPAEFLGIAAGLQSQAEDWDKSMVQEIRDGTLDDGSPVQIVKAGHADLRGTTEAYWLFKIRRDDKTIAEMEFVIGGESLLTIRRVRTEVVAEPGVAWNLQGLQTEAPATPSNQSAPKVSIKNDMVIPDVTVKHMAERTDFETYVPRKSPPWAPNRMIVDCFDPPSPGHRMFSISYKATDHRHVVIIQSYSYNVMFKKNLTPDKKKIIYTSPNGFKVLYVDPKQAKWFSNILIASSRYHLQESAAENRTGYILESPAGTYPTMAVNGPLTDQELHDLIDSLVPAKEYPAEEPKK